MHTKLLMLTLGWILITAFGRTRFDGGGEVLLPPTEVGTPTGDKVKKDIGPSGGTLSSVDGKLTLTVPPNAVTETVTFAVGPISNKAANSIGNGYRLEPDGRTFSTPVEISIRFDEKDLDGTVPEALFVAYQDKQGAWRADTSAKLDQSAKTITVATTHFTDYATFARLRLIPPKATVRVGKSQIVQLLVCSEPGLLDRLLSRPQNCEQPPLGEATWSLDGPGRIQTSEYGARQGMMFTTYIAPARKPNPNVAVVKLKTKFRTWNQETGESLIIEKNFESRITIIDSAYKATGTWSGMTFSGTVCRLDQPFTIHGQSQLKFNFEFTPSASGNDGAVAISGGGMGVTISNGSGTYTVTGTDTDSPSIAITASSFTGSYPGVGSAQGSGTRYIHLVPLETNECDGQ